MSCLKKKQKPLVPLKTLDVIFRRRYVPNTQYYFSNRKHGIAGDIHKQTPPREFKVPKSEKLLSYMKYSDQKDKLRMKARHSQPLHKKDNLRIAATRDISQRLYLEEPPDDVRAVVEIHPEFYTVIEGRPLRAYDDIKVYINNIRGYAMNTQQIGYRNDLIMKIAKCIHDESTEYTKIEANLKEHIKDFRKFLTEDYQKASSQVSKAEKLYHDLVAKDFEYLGYVSELTLVNNIFFKLDAIRGTLKLYRSFLYFVAPLSWRQLHDETLLSIKLKSSKMVFATENDLVESSDIDKIVELAKTELLHPLPTHIYFTEPNQMIYLFRTMELQSREYLEQVSQTDIPFRQCQERIKQLKRLTKQEEENFNYYIERISIEIDRQIYNAEFLKEKFMTMLYETFFETIASPNSLKLKICIEYVYEQIFGKCEEGHQNLFDPMKILEVMYENYNLRLDSLDFKIVNQARNEFFAQDLKMMQNAYKAQRELKSFTEMTQAMNKAFLPPKKYKRPIIHKTHKKSSSKEIATSTSSNNKMAKNYKLTPEEREGLIMFTEWCEGMDPGPYLSDYYKYVISTFRWTPRKSSLP